MEIENHPIPQDITSFQFRLIGNMTIKQFGYLAGGFIIAWVFYISPLFYILKIFFALIFASAGAVFAFVPIQGRPIDVMMVHFFKAVFSPTQYVYQQVNEKEEKLEEKEQKSLKNFNEKRQTISDMSERQLQDFLSTLPKATRKLDKKELVFFQNINQIQAQARPQSLPGYVAQHAYANVVPQQVAQSQPSLPQAKPLQPIKPLVSDLREETVSLQKDLSATKQQEAVATTTGTKEFTQAHEKVLELQKNLGDMLLQKQQLEEKLTSLQKQMQQGQQKVFTPSMATPQTQTQQEQTQLVRSVPQDMAKSVGLPDVPEFPNILSGIVKDPRGNPLPNILVEVKDTQGNAVRAFKTNALGQFASATPLTNGDFVIDFEDPRSQNKFDSVGFKAKGEIILPIEVISIDTREELRKSLFN